MRVNAHRDRGAVVVSLWAGPMCRGSFRMAIDDLDRLISTLGEIRASVRPAGTSTPQAGGSAQAGESVSDRESDSAPAAAEGTGPVATVDEQTPGGSGRAETGRLATAPVLRVA